MTPRRIRLARTKGQWRYRPATATWPAASSGRPIWHLYAPWDSADQAHATAAAMSAALGVTKERA